MASTTALCAASTALTLEELSTMLFLQPHQIEAVLDPGGGAASLCEPDRLWRVETVARLEQLVWDCAATGCPPCVRRAGVNRIL